MVKPGRSFQKQRTWQALPNRLAHPCALFTLLQWQTALKGISCWKARAIYKGVRHLPEDLTARDHSVSRVLRAATIQGITQQIFQRAADCYYTGPTRERTVMSHERSPFAGPTVTHARRLWNPTVKLLQGLLAKKHRPLRKRRTASHCSTELVSTSQARHSRGC